ncbi:MAG: gfo/Idh/MocA family oxidoreductase, partial [Planctomycetota bacterium]
RYWWDFGGGTLADFGCHFMDLPYWALDLREPISAVAKGEKIQKGDNQVPDVMQVDYQYPKRGDLDPVHLTWYCGGWKPEGADIYGKGNAVLFEGEHGRLVADYTTRKLFLDDDQKDAVEKKVTPIPNSIGHHREWIEAVKSGSNTTCNFDYSGALAEAVLLGNIAYRVGEPLQWNAKTLDAVGCPAAKQYIRREYRKGWSL